MAPYDTNPADKLAFQIALPKVRHQTQIGGAIDAGGLNVCQRIGAIDRRLAKSQHIEIRTVDDQDARLVVGHEMLLGTHQNRGLA